MVAYSLGAIPAARVAVAMPARVAHLVRLGPVMEITGRSADLFLEARPSSTA